MRRSLVLGLIGGLTIGHAAFAAKAEPPRFDALAVEAAEFSPASDAAKQAGTDRRKARPRASDAAPDPLILRTQILLSRARFSPGEIDGRPGENISKALRAFAQSVGLESDGTLTPELWDRLKQTSPGNALTEQPLTADYLKGPFLEKKPRGLDDMEGLPALSYANVEERLGETFHVSPVVLRALNPGRDFKQEGAALIVPNIAMAAPAGQVARVEVDKRAQTVRAFDASGKLLAFYPATVGSSEKPTPDGERKVVAVTRDPWYRYNPEYRFKGVKARHAFKIAPGPNNPVGLVWIALSEKGYGIHGTPEPSKISKAESNGCVRLTNWDALALAGMVQKGMSVTFVDEAGAAMAQDVSGRKRK